MKSSPHRLQVSVEEGFKGRVKLLAAKWGVKTNVALQRAVDLALTRERTDDEKVLLKIIAARTEQIIEVLLPL